MREHLLSLAGFGRAVAARRAYESYKHTNRLTNSARCRLEDNGGADDEDDDGTSERY